MTSRVTPTLALCLAGGLAAGLALARPGSTTEPSVAAAEAAPPTTIRTDGFGNPAPDAPVVVETPAAADSPAAAPASLTISGFAFDVPATIAAGATVSVTNADGAPHTVTATDGSFDTGTLGGNESGTFTAPSTPGTYDIFCAIHPSMTAQIVVG